ncbi:MAG: DUF4292 domain-containing protein [Bacteroidetes bacterium]|nr:DUF4292 domain-containing protein [Bacteroidota bacterium]
MRLQNKSHVLLLAACCLLASCARKTLSVTTSPKVPDISIEEIDFGYLHGRAQMNLKDDSKDVEVKAHIRLRKDSVIWMTFSVLGVQGGKALINNDSITIVSTVKKEYYVFTYEELSKRFQTTVNYNIIQAAMLGNLINPKSVSDRVEEDDAFRLLRQRQGKMTIINSINRNTGKIEKVQMKEDNSENALDISYSNFQPLGDKQFPYTGTIRVLYKAFSGLMPTNTTIRFEYVKAEIGDRELNFPFNIPRKYVRK